MIRRFRDDVLPMMGKELQPVVGALCPLSATSDADRRMEAGGVFGKIVLDDFHG
jgi:NADPH2:quinone reductase